MIRPERIAIAPRSDTAAQPGAVTVDGTVSKVVYLGALVEYTVTTGEGPELLVIRAHDQGGSPLSEASPVTLSVQADAVTLVPDAGPRRQDTPLSRMDA